MKKSIRKFLEFNGKAIYFLHKDGQYWIAVRPIVESLNIEYAWQLKQMKKHPIWGQVYEKTTMVDRNNALREMVALPENLKHSVLS